MHAAFIPYGHKRFVEAFLRDIEAQKYNLPVTSPDGKKTKSIAIEGQLRVLPFGVYEHVFPKEYADQVLTTLHFHITSKKISKTKLNIIRRMLNLKKAPKKFDTSKGFFWVRENVSVYSLGIRKDKTITEPAGEMKGWTHEAI